jgi:hypothetical protein
VTESDAATQSVPGRPRRRLIPALIVGVVLVVGLSVGVTYAFTKSDPTSTPSTNPSASKTSDAALIEACHQGVLDRLKSPGTAKFGGEFKRGSTPPEVVGWVDSENGFSALVRSDWVCTGTANDVGWSVEVTLTQRR